MNNIYKYKHNLPNYKLAKKVFLEFNEFNIKNINEIKFSPISGNIPKSLLPYPKNYIKCAYYLFLEYAKKNEDLKMFKLIQEVGVSLFYNYPDFYEYKKRLKEIQMLENGFRKNGEEMGEEYRNKFKASILEAREAFKKLYGAYEISEEDYNNSPNSIDSTNDKLINDFGFLPEIEKDRIFD